MVKQNQQIVEQKNTVEKKKDRRVAKSMIVAVSCEIARLDNQKETYKVQSENDVNKYYIVKFIDGIPVYCSCKDFETQSQKNRNHICKHQRAIVLAENYGLVTTKQEKLQNNDIEETFECVQTNVLENSSINDDNEDDSNSYQSQNNAAKFEEVTVVAAKSSYKDDDYTF